MNKHLYDFRTSIVKRKRDKEYWDKWEEWNVLYRTLSYEISGSRDVESYGYVRNQVFEYFDDYKQYVGDEASLDIMNGWWFCFKTLFGIREGRRHDETKAFIYSMMEKVAGISDRKELIDKVNKEYKLDKKVIEVFLEFLETVYTIGNITPVPKRGNVHADDIDSWEYKMFKSDAVKYKNENYKEYFYFVEYEYKKEVIWWERLKSEDNKIQILYDYMYSRVELIKKRGAIIVNRNNRCD